MSKRNKETTQLVLPQIRDEIIRLRANGMTQNEIARKLHIKRNVVSDAIRYAVATGWKDRGPKEARVVL